LKLRNFLTTERVLTSGTYIGSHNQRRGIAVAIVLAQNMLELANNTLEVKRTEYAFRRYNALFLLFISKDFTI
jgi:hypothetical protein